jgi:hypothetical protein
MQQKQQLITHNVAFFLQVCSRLASKIHNIKQRNKLQEQEKKKIKEDLHDQRHWQYV